MKLNGLNKSDPELTPDQCSCCRNERINNGKPPRLFIPVKVPDIKTPYLICSYCDGDALIAAKALESERLSGH